MANNVNTGFAKCFIFFMAVVILVQGAVYLALPIWGFVLRTCSEETTDISAKPFQFVIDLIYFANENCGNPSVTVTGVDAKNELNIDWSKSELITNRFYIFLIVYTVISALWVVTSLLVFASICGPVTKVVSAVCFWPWFLVVMAGSVVDAVATGYFIKDIVNTTSVDDTFAYIGVTEPDNITMSVLRTYDSYFVTPSIIMTCIASRVVIIWLLNIFGCSFCLSLSRVLAGNNSAAKSNSNVAAQNSNYYGANPTRAPQQQPQMQERQRIETPQRQFAYMDSPAVPQQQQQQQQQRVAENVVAIGSAPVIEEIMMTTNNNNYNNNKNVLSRQASTVNNTTYRSTDAHPDKLDYPRASTPEVRIRTPQPQLSVESPLNNRYSDAYQFQLQQQQQQPQASQRVSDELRSQLPWSYTSMLAKPQVSRKPQIYPDIPEASNNVTNEEGYTRA